MKGSLQRFCRLLPISPNSSDKLQREYRVLGSGLAIERRGCSPNWECTTLKTPTTTSDDHENLERDELSKWISKPKWPRQDHTGWNGQTRNLRTDLDTEPLMPLNSPNCWKTTTTMMMWPCKFHHPFIPNGNIDLNRGLLKLLKRRQDVKGILKLPLPTQGSNGHQASSIC